MAYQRLPGGDASTGQARLDECRMNACFSASFPETALEFVTAPREHPLQDWFSPGRFVLIVAALLTACFLPVLIGSETFFFRDYAIFSYPLAAYHRDAFWRGEIPLWNPLNYCGMPFLAQWNTLVLYPFSLIYLVLPLPWSLNFFCLVHMGLAAVGMYYLARAWTGSNFAGAAAGVGYIFSGVILSCLKWPNTIAALAWMPWLVLTVERAVQGSWGAVAAAALVGAIQMLCGAPEILMLTWLFCGALVLHRFATARPLDWQIFAKFAAIVILVAGLCAAQLLPFLEFLGESQRDQDFAGSSWPMPIWGWLNFLVPLFRTFPSYHGVHAQPWQYWISTYYVSVILTVCAFYGLARHRGGRPWLIGLITFLMLWLALGDKGLLYKWAREFVPGFGMMRFPVKFVLLAAFLLPLLAAYGIARFDGRQKRRLWVIAGLYLTGLLAICLYNEFRPFPYTSAATISWNGFWRAFFLALAVTSLITMPKWNDGFRPGAALIFCLAVALDGITHAPWQNPTAPASVYEGNVAKLDPPPKLGEARAMISPEAMHAVDHLNLPKPEDDVRASRASLFCNLNLLERIPKVDGFYSLYPGRTAEVLNRVYESTNLPPAGLMDFLSVTRITAKGSWEKWESRQALPLIQTPSRFAVTSQCLTNLLNENFDPRELVYLERDPRRQQFNEAVEVREAHFASHEITFSYSATGDALLVIPQTHAANWKAEIDGLPVEILVANHAFQAIAGPPGNHRVKLRYEADEFRLGGMISGVTAALVAGLALFSRREPSV